MHSRLKRKARAIALGGILIVTQCCCCIIPIRWQVNNRLPEAQASAPGAVVERVVCEFKTALSALPVRWGEAQQCVVQEGIRHLGTWAPGSRGR